MERAARRSERQQETKELPRVASVEEKPGLPAEAITRENRSRSPSITLGKRKRKAQDNSCVTGLLAKRQVITFEGASAPVRKDCDDTEPELSNGGASEPRVRVQQKLVEALLHGETTDVELIGLERAKALASDIERELHAQLSLSKEYVAQARSIVFNIKDTRNPNFQRKLLCGFFEPWELPKMTGEEMASEAKAAERATWRQKSWEAIALKPGKYFLTNDHTCEKCSGTNCAASTSMAVESCVRSGGEPLPTVVTHIRCLSCCHAWTLRSVETI